MKNLQTYEELDEFLSEQKSFEGLEHNMFLRYKDKDYVTNATAIDSHLFSAFNYTAICSEKSPETFILIFTLIPENKGLDLSDLEKNTKNLSRVEAVKILIKEVNKNLLETILKVLEKQGIISAFK